MISKKEGPNSINSFDHFFTGFYTMNDKFLEILKKASPTTILIIILFYFGNIYLTKIEKIETELLSIRLELNKLQMQLVPANELQQEMKSLIKIHEKIYHNQK